jgi:hypothetical protein
LKIFSRLTENVGFESMHRKENPVCGLFRSDLRTNQADVVKNELRVLDSVFDFQQIGQSFTIKDAAGLSVLDLIIDPPKTLIVNRLHMLDASTAIEVDWSSFRLNGKFGDLAFVGGTYTNMKTCISISGEN